MKTVLPLEGLGSAEAVAFYIYDEVGKGTWGMLRVRREKNPDFLIIEVMRSEHGAKWKPILHLTAAGDHLLQRNFGLKGGSDAPSGTSTSTDSIS